MIRSGSVRKCKSVLRHQVNPKLPKFETYDHNYVRLHMIIIAVLFNCALLFKMEFRLRWRKQASPLLINPCRTLGPKIEIPQCSIKYIYLPKYCNTTMFNVFLLFPKNAPQMSQNALISNINFHIFWAGLYEIGPKICKSCNT